MSKKDDLLFEVEKRRSLGRNIQLEDNPTIADIEAALELDDEDANDHAELEETGDLPEGDRNNIPEVPLYPSQPKNSEYKGRYVSKKDSETYALAVVKDDAFGNTHKLKNTAHFWEGPEAEFLANFTEKR